MKKLFAVSSTKTDDVKEYFEKKELAKQLRDKLNGGKWDNEKTSHEFVVSRGPDHFHGESGLTPQTPKTLASKKRKPRGQLEAN